MLRRLLLWILALIALLIVLSLMFGGFTKGTKATGAGPSRSAVAIRPAR